MQVRELEGHTTEKSAVAEVERCPNCGAEALGPYCYQCGQRYTSLVAPLRRLLAEALDAVFSLDNRLWRTLKVLLVRPGTLTEAYLEGKRMGYVSPFRLYLLFSILYFFVASLTGTTNFLFFKFDGTGQLEAFGQILPRMMFVIVPCFAMLLKGLFRKPRRLYAAHLVFALHIHALWYFLFTLCAVLEPYANQVVEGGVFTVLSVTAFVMFSVARLAIAVFLFRAMRRVYGQSWGKTFLKIVLLFLGYFLLLSVIAMAFFWIKGVSGS